MRTDGMKATILVLDDEQTVRTSIRIALEKAGFRVQEAAGAEEALGKYHQAPADVAIVDIFLPGKSGLEVIQELRRDFPEVKIIAISGVDVRDGIALATLIRAYGVDCAFEKPFQLRDLVDAVKQLVGGDHPTAETELP